MAAPFKDIIDDLKEEVTERLALRQPAAPFSLLDAIKNGRVAWLLVDVQAMYLIAYRSKATRISGPPQSGVSYFLKGVFGSNYNGNVEHPEHFLRGTEALLARAHPFIDIFHCGMIDGAGVQTPLKPGLYTIDELQKRVEEDEDHDPLFMVPLAVHENILLKAARSTFSVPTLSPHLRNANKDVVIVTGLFAGECIHQTIMDALEDGKTVIIIPELIRDQNYSTIETKGDRAAVLKDIYGPHVHVIPLQDVMNALAACAELIPPQEPRRPLSVHPAVSAVRGRPHYIQAAQ